LSLPGDPAAAERPSDRGYPSRPSGIAVDVFSVCQVIVVLVDLDAKPPLLEDELRQIFRLTRAETRLAKRFLSGDSVEVAADALGITYETARNELKSILRKTDTHRQAELVALLSRLTYPSKKDGSPKVRL
jgi:DNA-binding CsgD family transcriptional regulator